MACRSFSKTVLFIGLHLMLGSFLSPAAFGQSDDVEKVVVSDDKPTRFELTPMVGARFGGTFDDELLQQELDVGDSESVALVFDIRASADTQYEILYSRQETELETDAFFSSQGLVDLTTEYFQVGGTYLLEGDRHRPYIAATLGVSRFNPESGDLSSENFFAMTFGGGYRFNLTPRLGLRLEGRAYLNWIDSDSEIFCQTGPNNNICAVTVDGDLLTQFEASIGLTFKF